MFWVFFVLLLVIVLLSMLTSVMVSNDNVPEAVLLLVCLFATCAVFLGMLSTYKGDHNKEQIWNDIQNANALYSESQ